MFELKAPAKINWFLHVTGKRADGYHEVRSLIQCVELYDFLTFEESDSVEVISGSSVPEKENLVYRAALALRDAAGAERGARITLTKRIPLSSGLGGGSSDAACALKGLGRLWGLDVPRQEMFRVASALGSDVPFFLDGPCAFVEGRGEKTTPAPVKRKYALLLAKPPVGVSSGRAYSELGTYRKGGVPPESFLCALNGGDFAALRGMLRNDLEEPVFARFPEIRALKERMLEAGALLSAMSGSGSTVFGVFEDVAGAEAAAGFFPSLWRCAAETITGPEI